MECLLEQFRKTRRLFEGINGGLFLRKTPLECVLPVYTISETAIDFTSSSLDFSRWSIPHGKSDAERLAAVMLFAATAVKLRRIVACPSKAHRD